MATSTSSARAGPPSKDNPRKTAITNVRVFEGGSLSEPKTVVIEGGVIGSNVDDAQVIDGKGLFLFPGFIDAHIHLNAKPELEAMAKYGVTTGLDMASWPPSKIKALHGYTGLTDFRTPGLPATSPGSLHSVILPLPKEGLISNPEEAKRFVSNRIAEGVDYIKMIVDIPGPDQETLNAVAAAAHEHGKMVVAHAATYETFIMAQNANADIITHAPRDKALDAEVCARMVKEHRICVPTLTMMEAVTKPLSWMAIFGLLMRPFMLWEVIKIKRKQGSNSVGEKYENARDSVSALHHAGVPILAGTDAHEEPTSPVSVKHGDSLHHELELLVEAGLSTVEVLQASTSLPAKYFNLPDRGVVEIGKRADLVLLSQNPIEDIRASRSIERVWCAGIEVSRP